MNMGNCCCYCCTPGCQRALLNGDDYYRSNLGLTDRDKMLIRFTWRYLSNDMVTRGIRVFSVIFHLAPEVREMFEKRDKNEEKTINADDDIFERPYIRAHAIRFMQAVGAAVDHMDNPNVVLRPLLHQLGRKHGSITDFQSNHFSVFVEALAYVWQAELGQRYTIEVAAAWNLIFDFIMRCMQEGHVDSGRNSNSE